VAAADERVAEAANEAGAVTALFESAPPEEAGILPRGSRRSLELAGDSEHVILIDPRNPELSGRHIRYAAERLESCAASYVVSVFRPEDHPCQGKLFFRLREIGTVSEFGLGAWPTPSSDRLDALLSQISEALPGAKVRGAGLCVGSYGAALLVERDGDASYLVLSGGDAVTERDALEIFEPRKPARIVGRAVSGDPAVFRLDRRPENGFGTLTWMLLNPTSDAGAYDVRFNYEPEDAPWETDPENLRIRNTVSRQTVTGRHDFPEIFVPEGSLTAIRAGMPFPDSATVAGMDFEVLILDADEAVRVQTALDLLRYENTLEEADAL
jgi:hypothetical protein